MGKLDISGLSIESRKMESEQNFVEVELSKSSDVLLKNWDEINKEEKLVVDEAERKLDKLEGFIGRDENDVCLIFEEDRNLEFKVHDTLKRHVEYWRETEASSFAISVVENGYVPQLWENPPRYEESNNMSYRKERLWANKAVFKFDRAKLVK